MAGKSRKRKSSNSNRVTGSVPIIIVLLIIIGGILVFGVSYPYQTTEDSTVAVEYTYEVAEHARDCDYTAGCRCTDTHWFFAWCTDCMCSKTGVRYEPTTITVTKHATLAQQWGWVK